TEVPERELPSSFRYVGSMGWVREPLDDAMRGRRQVIAPPAAATIGTPAHGAKGALLAQLREPGTVFMEVAGRSRSTRRCATSPMSRPATPAPRLHRLFRP
ncbi:MAG TPA: hypothetical protein VE733_23445, partial [Streptosporangiaceae bacterium]|nr:hypothetical protein [Streptosporangiaceae bacterium]